MSFPWYDYQVPRFYADTFPEKRAYMFRKEIARRVRILRSLGHSKEEVKLRILGHLLWDLELHQSSPILDDYEGVIDWVWQRG